MIATTESGVVLGDPLLAAARFGAAVDELAGAAAVLAKLLPERPSVPLVNPHGQTTEVTEAERLAVLLGVVVQAAQGAKKRADRYATRRSA